MVPNHLSPRMIVLAEKAYDSDRIRELTHEQGATPNIPLKSNRKWKPCFSKRLYRERNLFECFFSKHFRCVATRHDKLADNFLAMVQLASMRLWLRAYATTAQFHPSTKLVESCYCRSIQQVGARLGSTSCSSPPNEVGL